MNHQTRTICAGWLFAVLAAVGVASAQTITSIGSLGPTTRSEAFAVSADGSAVVGYAAMITGALRAVRWTPSAGLQDLGVLPGGIRSLGFGVSGDGGVVTGMAIVSGGGRVFRWTPSGGMQDLGTLPVQNVSYGFAISADGLVIGGGPSSGADGHALTWTAATGLVDLGALPGDTASALYALSADGRAGAGYSGSGTSHVAMRWTGAAGMHSLGVLAGGAASEGAAISADGSVVAGWSEAAGGLRAFRWTAADGMQNLGFVPGRSSSNATAISADGSVVAGYDEVGAFLWTPSLGMVDLASYLAARGVNMTGWHLQACYAMSADGTAMAGTGSFNGPSRGWVVRGLPSVCMPVITTQPISAMACPTASAAFTVGAAAGSTPTFQWQISVGETWATLGNDPLALPCGGSAFLTSPFVSDARIAIRPCPGVSTYQVRCLVSNMCGSVASNPAIYTVCAADFNCDGAISSQDFFNFLTAFFDRLPGSDFNADGTVNSQDFFDFLGAFFTGC